MRKGVGEATRFRAGWGVFVFMGLGLGVGGQIACMDWRRELLNGCCLLRGLTGGHGGPSRRLDLHWFSSGIGHDTNIDGEQENADG